MLVGMFASVPAALALRASLREAARLPASEASMMQIGEAPQPNTQSKQDFARRLRSGLSETALLQRFSSACADANVMLASAQVFERLPTLDRLGRVEISATLRGSYAATKQAIEQVVERFDAATVPQLRIRRTSRSGEVETTLTLAVWSSPLIEIGAPSSKPTADARLR